LFNVLGSGVSPRFSFYRIISVTDTKGLITENMAARAVASAIPVPVRTQALSYIDSPVTVDAVHRTLEFIGTDRVAAAFAEGVSVSTLSEYLGVPSGMVYSWVHADDDRARALTKASLAQAAEEGHAFLHDLIKDDRSTMDKERERMVSAKLKAVKLVDDRVSDVDPKQKDTGTVVHIDLSSALGRL
jgi:hypothetical protein